MATTTPNFGWAVPTSTDLVKDGAVAIETLGDSIDASLVDLKGGTTGQVLAKATGTDMDFTWATPAAGGGLVKIASNTFSAVSSVSLPNGTFSSTYRNYKVQINIDGVASSPSGLFLRLRNGGSDKTGASYFGGMWKVPYSGSAAMQFQTTGGTSQQINDSFNDVFTVLEIANIFSSTERTSIQVDSVEGELVYRQAGICTFLSDDSCDSLTFYRTAGNMTGRYTVYGYEI